MKSSQDFVWSTAGFSAGRIFRPPTLPSPTLTRAGLPVVSNRAFISSWMTRRNKVAAVAHVTRKN